MLSVQVRIIVAAIGRPVNVDGQETIYTFHAPSGDERIASCEVEIDPNHPLFRAVTVALAARQP